MHTVFINTTGTTVGGRTDVLGIAKEFKELTLLNCPLSSCLSEEEGFAKCALQIGEMIDTHKEINNAFNLIVYVDLLEFEEYREVFSGGKDLMEVNAAHEALRNMLSRFVSEKLWEKLDELGRVPGEKILLLLEQNRREDASRGKGISNGEDGGRYSVFDGFKVKKQLSLLGLPSPERLKEIVDTSPADGLEERLRAACAEPSRSPLVLNARRLYADRIELLCAAIAKEGVRPERACLDFCDGLEKLYESDTVHRVLVSDFITDRRSLRTNKEMETKRNLLVQCLLLHCVNSGSVYDVPGVATAAKTVPEMTGEQWKELLLALANKKADYAREEMEISSMQKTFSKLKMVPKLYAMDYKKFGLNDTGYPLREYVVQTMTAEERKKAAKEAAKEAKEKKKQNKEEKAPPTPLPIDLGEDKEVLVDQHGKALSWFGEKEFKPFDADGVEYTEDDGKLLSANEYVERAKDLAGHHVKFLENLERHVRDVMSNYAGRSLNHKPAVLRKRSVSTGGDSEYAAKNDYKYAGKSKTDETAPLESVLKASKRSYLTVLTNYLKFNAGRGVAVTTLKEQSEWFINRVRQIEKSLKMLFTMLLIVGGVLLFAYAIPFLLIQWEVITKGLDTLVIALGFLAAPFALLVLAYRIAVAVQKRKMRKAWRKLVEISNELLAENSAAVKQYDELLCAHIPSLRWAYEFVLDVDFYRECCEIAGAKLTHHRGKLHEHCEIVGNILEDLEGDGLEDEARTAAEGRDFDIDYTISFCEGKNREFYSIIDKKTLERING